MLGNGCLNRLNRSKLLCSVAERSNCGLELAVLFIKSQKEAFKGAKHREMGRRQKGWLY